MTGYPLHLVDADLVGRCRDRLLEAIGNRDRACADIRQAEAALADAVAARAELVERQGREGGVTPAESLASRCAVANSEGHLLMLREAASTAQRAVDAAQRALDTASGEAHRACSDHGIDERIAAADEIEAAEMALTRAKDRYAAAGEIIAEAALHGAKIPNMPILSGGPYGRFGIGHGDAERRAWGRPAKVPEAAE